MDNITIEVPEGELCESEISSCPCICVDSECGDCCQNFENKDGTWVNLQTNNKGDRIKCPACISAIKAYKDMHDYEKAHKKINKMLKLWIEPRSNAPTLTEGVTDAILDALEYKKEKI